MAEQTHEFTGKTVDEAVAEGLSKLKLSRSEVAVEVLSKGSRGIFGIGSEPARIRITVESERKPSRSAGKAGQKPPATPAQDVSVVEVAPAEPPVPEFEAEAEEEALTDMVEASLAAEAEAIEEDETETPTRVAEGGVDISDDELATMAAEMLGEIVRLMGFEADVVASWQEPDDEEGSPYLMLDVEGQDLGALIGRRGETLASMQYLVRLMVNQRIKQWRNIVVDVEGYKERRVAQLNQLALRMADQVAESGRAVALEPMPPNERRIVHIALRDHPQVYTQSSGEGERRKVNIVPRDNA